MLWVQQYLYHHFCLNLSTGYAILKPKETMRWLQQMKALTETSHAQEDFLSEKFKCVERY